MAMEHGYHGNTQISIDISDYKFNNPKGQGQKEWVLKTQKIADSFSKGVEFFSSFGRNPVSCATGLAVLDVIENEKLQENAKKL